MFSMQVLLFDSTITWKMTQGYVRSHVLRLALNISHVSKVSAWLGPSCFTLTESECICTLGYFLFQPVVQDRSVRGMYYPMCGKGHIKDPLLLIRKSSLCDGSGFHRKKYVIKTICLMSNSRWYENQNALEALLNKTNFAYREWSPWRRRLCVLNQNESTRPCWPTCCRNRPWHWTRWTPTPLTWWPVVWRR